MLGNNEKKDVTLKHKNKFFINVFQCRYRLFCFNLVWLEKFDCRKESSYVKIVIVKQRMSNCLDNGGKITKGCNWILNSSKSPLDLTSWVKYSKVREKSKQCGKVRNMILTGQRQINYFIQHRQTEIFSKILGCR